ncbi:MAG: VOC family protein [Caulobacteraceae bacterium]|nr:VOC family protein [Caulobacteraceae bacterium]
MTRLAGPIRQVGLIVRDAEAAARYWAEVVGVGPFVFFRDLAFDADYRYRGRPSEPPVVTIAVGQSGPLQIEIIQQHNTAPSAYVEFLEAGLEGMQHVSPWCSTPEEYDATRARLLQAGLTIVHEGRAAGSTVRFAYFEGPAKGWPLIEISEALLPVIRPLSETLEAMNRDWDGLDPFIEAPEMMARLAAAANAS